MRQNLLIAVAGVLFLTTAAVYVIRLFWGNAEPTIEQLLEIALNAPSAAEQEQAAAALAERGEPAITSLRRLSQESGTNEVRAAAFFGLGRLCDFESMDAILEAMQDDSPVVRGRAAQAAAKLLTRDRRFQSHGSEEDRARIVRFYREDWEEIKNSSYFEAYKAGVRRENEQRTQ